MPSRPIRTAARAAWSVAVMAPALLALDTGRAELAPPNAAGVAMGHLHYHVRDVAANRAFWVALGGTPSSFAGGETVRFPNVLILISEAQAGGAAAGSVVDHVAFRVESLAELEARGLVLEPLEGFAGIASVETPEGERIELFEDGTATNIGFAAAPGARDATAERHNRPLTAPIVTHHLHFYVPDSDVEAARDWYVEHFGAVPGRRWRYAAADLPGMNLNFSAPGTARAPTRGRVLDHVGFEVADLERFCRELEAKGVVLEQPYRAQPSGLAHAFLTDPWGTRIELTEGLGKLK